MAPANAVLRRLLAGSPSRLPGRRHVVAVAAVVAGFGAAAVVGRRRFERAVATHVEGLRADADRECDGRYASADVAALPAPVRRYFERVLDDGQPSVDVARLRQRGALRLGGREGQWWPFTATQHVTTSPPGFVWDATVDLGPLPVRVVDLYRRGEGRLRGRLLGVVPVASAGPGPGMDEAELARYLAEGVWVPTALLPDRGVTWEPVDDRSARATLEHRGVTASVVFHFDDRDEVERVTAERYRQEDDAETPWTGYFDEYEDRGGLRIPTVAAVAWNTPDGDVRYWRADVDETTYGSDAAPFQS